MKALSWYLSGFASGAITFTGNWWWALLWLAAVVIDFCAEVFRRTKLGKALARRRSE